MPEMSWDTCRGMNLSLFEPLKLEQQLCQLSGNNSPLSLSEAEHLILIIKSVPCTINRKKNRKYRKHLIAGKEQNHNSSWHLRIVSVLSTMQEQEGKDKNDWYQRIFLVRKGALLSLLKEFKVGLIHLDSSMISIPVISVDFFQLIHFLSAGKMLVWLPGIP